jgi:hypothetical protein
MPNSAAWRRRRLSAGRLATIRRLRVRISVFSSEPLLATCLISLPLLLLERLTRIPVLASRSPVPSARSVYLLKRILRVLW